MVSTWRRFASKSRNRRCTGAAHALEAPLTEAVPIWDYMRFTCAARRSVTLCQPTSFSCCIAAPIKLTSHSQLLTLPVSPHLLSTIRSSMMTTILLAPNRRAWRLSHRKRPRAHISSPRAPRSVSGVGACFAAPPYCAFRVAICGGNP